MPSTFASESSAVLYSNTEVLGLAGEFVLELAELELLNLPSSVSGLLAQPPVLFGNFPGSS